MHSVTRAHEYHFTEPIVFAGRSRGYTQAVLVDQRQGSVHTGLSLDELAAGGTIATHLHSFEEGFYVLAGRAVVTVDERQVTVGPGDFGLFKVGVAHAWANPGNAPVRWLQMTAPQPKPAGKERGTFFPKSARRGPRAGEPL